MEMIAKEAIEAIKEDTVGTLRVGGSLESINEDMKEAIEFIEELQSSKELGEVFIDYYNETGKTVVLSIGLRSYQTVLNDIEVEHINISDELYMNDEVDFGSVVAMYEDEGNSYFEDIFVAGEDLERKIKEYFLSNN